MQEFSFGEMIFPEVYEKRRRKKGELIYCSVVFDNGLKTYYYRTEDDSLDAGDDVVVPAGSDNHLSIAKIVKVEYFAPADVPFPIEKTKVILRRCTEDDYNEIG
nr:Sig70_famx3: RNA polymerase sigma-70 factor, TIGR02954 [uncultured bacterium]